MVTIKVDHSKPSASKLIVRNWLQQSAETLANYDVQGHLALISKEVKVHGVPELEVIDYKDWAAQVEHEFSEKMIQSVRFKGDHIHVENEDHIMFHTLEVITAVDGKVVQNSLEVVLKKEADEVWRVIQERILKPEESQHLGLTA